MARNACRLGLYGLGTSDFQTLGCGVAVQRHVLSLERSGMVAVLQEDAAEGSGNDALTDVAARSSEHHGMQFLVFHFSFLKARIEVRITS